MGNLKNILFGKWSLWDVRKADWNALDIKGQFASWDMKEM